MIVWSTLCPCIFSRLGPLSVAAHTVSSDVFVIAKIQNFTHACTGMHSGMSHVYTLCIVTTHSRLVWICLMYSTWIREIANTPTLQWTYACKLLLPWDVRTVQRKKSQSQTISQSKHQMCKRM
jgi:hypothetical protein